MSQYKFNILRQKDNRWIINCNYSNYILITSVEKNISSLYMELPEQAAVKIKSFSGVNGVKNAINYLLKDQFIL